MRKNPKWEKTHPSSSARDLRHNGPVVRRREVLA